jgi:hypothetical protein
MDTVIEQGGTFYTTNYYDKTINNIPNKQRYIEKGGKLVTLTPEEELRIAVNTGNLNKFKKIVESGAKVKIGLINELFKHDYEYGKLKQYGQEEKIKQYLRDSDLEQIIANKDLKKIDKIKSYLGATKSVDRQYPHGYKIYRALKFVDKTHPKGAKEILKFIFNLGHGNNSYNPILHGSHWMDGYKALIRPVCDISPDGTHTLSGLGVAKLARLEKKFGTMKIDPPPYI